MRYLWHHIQDVFATYKGDVPLSHFLRSYCRQFPKLGSRDRRILTSVSYTWYRCAKGLVPIVGDGINSSLQQQVMECLLLCKVPPSEYERLFKGVDVTIGDYEVDLGRLFDNDVPLSGGISRDEWLHSMLLQPNLFIRVRKKKDEIQKLLDAKNIAYNSITDVCMSLSNGAPIDKLLPIDSYVVQDASSQGTGRYFEPQSGEKWYDCCSGAGGKSLLLMDMCKDVRLTVSDTRESIISNLNQRFRIYGHKLPASYVFDVANKKEADSVLNRVLFDGIICDVPCTGSGTWARTPEQLYFFKKDSIQQYASRQKAIALNVARFLKKGGKLIYITCSVFKQENEDVVDVIVAQTDLRVLHQGLINGISIGADNMYIAVLQR